MTVNQKFDEQNLREVDEMLAKIWTYYKVTTDWMWIPTRPPKINLQLIIMSGAITVLPRVDWLTRLLYWLKDMT